MSTARFRIFLLISISAAIMAGCKSKTAPPDGLAPQTVSGMTRDRTSYAFLKWNEGLAIMLVDQCDVHSMTGSSNSGEPNRHEGVVRWWDKDSNKWKDAYSWQVRTSDGQTAVLTINNVNYDLANGAVFRIDTGGEKVIVKQLDRDLSNVQPDSTSCDYFVESIPELANRSEESKPE